MSEFDRSYQLAEQNRALLREAVNRVAGKIDRPTVEELTQLFELARTLPTPDYSDTFRIHKERNTELYQEIVREARELLSGVRSSST